VSRRDSGSARGLRSRLGLTFAVTGALLAAVLAVGVLLGIQVDRDQRRVTDELFRAYETSNDLFVSAVDQETAVRGYALTGEEDFLEPYLRRNASAVEDFRELQRLVRADPEVSRALDAAAGRARSWRQEWAAPTVDAVRRGGPESISSAQVAEGKRLFDEVRSSFAIYIDRLVDARNEARAHLQTTTHRLFLLVFVAAVVVLTAAVALWIALRTWVTRPLDELGRETQLVQNGAYNHRVAVDGPPEITRLADDIDAMRLSVVTSYAEALSAREEVEAQRRLLEVQTEELRRSNTELEQFAYVASHDLQEPLRKVASFCQMLERRYKGQLDDRADQYIGFAVDGAKRMQALINDLLAFSRVGRMTTGEEELELQDCLDTALRTLDTRIEEAGATVTYDPMPAIRGERTLLVQVFQNLISNALKFRSEAPPRIHFGVTPAGDFWQLCCADNGIGIEPQYADRIFVIFQRLHAKDEYAGTGIGLALCKKIIEYHGGRIWLRTESDESPAPGGDAVDSGAVGSGAVFFWTLPVATARPDHQPDTSSGVKQGADA
jgi:signal transduction histidine kinase